jgi:hypothetical protein
MLNDRRNGINLGTGALSKGVPKVRDTIDPLPFLARYLSRHRESLPVHCTTVLWDSHPLIPVNDSNLGGDPYVIKDLVRDDIRRDVAVKKTCA